MSLDQRINTEQLNIREFSLEQRGVNIEFNPMEEVTPEQWKALREFILTADSQALPIGTLTFLKGINPELFPDMAEVCRQRIISKFTKDLLKAEEPGQSITDPFVDAAELKRLDPETFAAENLTAKLAPLWQKIKLNPIRNNFSPRTYCYLKILFPDEVTPEYMVPKDIILADFKTQKAKREKYWELIRNDAASLKMSYPDALVIGPGDWKEMKKNFKQSVESSLIHGDFYYTCYKLKEMTILGAKEAKIGDNGLEIVMPEKNTMQKAPEIPQIKNF